LTEQTEMGDSDLSGMSAALSATQSVVWTEETLIEQGLHGLVRVPDGAQVRRTRGQRPKHAAANARRLTCRSS
jgi:hypothetical protein